MKRGEERRMRYIFINIKSWSERVRRNRRIGDGGTSRGKGDMER